MGLEDWLYPRILLTRNKLSTNHPFVQVAGMFWWIKRTGRFRKLGYPPVIHFSGILHEINHLFGIPPFIFSGTIQVDNFVIHILRTPERNMAVDWLHEFFRCTFTTVAAKCAMVKLGCCIIHRDFSSTSHTMQLDPTALKGLTVTLQ